MDFGELNSEFFRMERDMDLLDKTVSGVYFWERLRFIVNKQIVTNYGVSEGTVSNSDSLSDYLSGGRLLLQNVLSRNPFFARSADLLFYGKGRRKKLEDDLWWDIYIDPVLTDLDDSSVCLERPYDVSHRRPAKTEGLRYTDLVQYTGTILENLGISNVSLSEKEATLLGDIESEIRSRFNVEVPLTRMVREDLGRRRIRLPLYERIVRRINPEFAFLTSAYGGRETFVEACQSQGIPVVELQHGVVSKYHMGYSFPYDDKNVFPDYFFSFGEYWLDAVEFPIPDERVISVGFPYLEKRSTEYEKVDQENQVIFISQPTIGGRLSRFALQLDRSPDWDCRIVYKLHPKEYDEWEEEYPDLVDSDIRVVTEDPPLYQLLAESRIQIGVASTALYEGLRFGLDTYVLDTPGAENIEHLYDNGFARLVESVGEFKTMAKSESRSERDVDHQYFFETDAAERFKRAVQNVIEERREDNVLGDNDLTRRHGSPDNRD